MPHGNGSTRAGAMGGEEVKAVQEASQTFFKEGKLKNGANRTSYATSCGSAVLQEGPRGWGGTTRPDWRPRAGLSSLMGVPGRASFLLLAT